ARPCGVWRLVVAVWTGAVGARAGQPWTQGVGSTAVGVGGCRGAALRHQCDSGASQSGPSKVTGAPPEPAGHLAPKHEDPPGSPDPATRLPAKTREASPVTAPTGTTPTAVVSPTRMVTGRERMNRDQEPPAANQTSSDPRG